MTGRVELSYPAYSSILNQMRNRMLTVETRIWKEMLILFREIVRPEVFRGYGFTRTEFDILAHLCISGEMTQSTLLKNLLTTKANVSQVLGRLEEKGLVARRTGEEDRRCQVVALTEEGRRVVSPLVESHVRYIGSFFSGLTDLEKEILLKILEKISSKLNEKS
ncbi:MAG: MarR family transcriptional regulator [Deltaproteobacteria bacterium]|nr:MAG: MarR family transcriptional regulator [Deltaproteobacteria bacterium]